VDGGAAGTGGYAGLAQHRHRLALLQGALDAAQLRIDVAEGGQLREHEGIVSLAEAVQVEDEATEVSIGELSGLAQEAGSATGAPT
jgi:hypothetical protein